MRWDNDQFLNYLLEDLKGPVILFLGAGSSMEGVSEKGEPFPSFGKMQMEIIEKFGNLKQRLAIQAPENSPPFEIFLEVMEELAKEEKANSVLRNYLQGKPGYAHFQLAATILAKGSNLFLTLTPNYDDLFVRAMGRLSESVSLPFKVYPIQECQSREFANMARLTSEFPVLVKLFGDLGIHQGLFQLHDLYRLIYSNLESLKNTLSNPLLFIGYSFGDELYRAMLVESRHSVYIVTPSDTEIELKTNRKCRQFRGTFGEFMHALLEKLEPKLRESIDNFLLKVDPETKFHRIAEVKPLLAAMSARGKGTVEERFQIQSGGRSNRGFLIERQVATAWVEGFLASSYPLMLLLGESGLGKSCFLYEMADKSSEQVIVSFFAGSTLVGETGFLGKICQELNTASKSVKSLFKHLDELLEREIPSKQWLIIIDGLNESPNFKILMEQILDMGGWELKHIKVLYSCRTVFWDNQQLANEQLAKMHYSDWTCRIDKFTPEEAETAYRNYQSLLDIPTSYAEVHPKVKVQLANPLMMRMIMQTYQGRRLLEYIPATTVFDNYWDHLCEKSRPKGSPLNMEVLKLLAKRKIDGFQLSPVNSSDQYFLDDFLNDPRVTEEAILAWQDEGVLVWIDAKNQSFRFTFDRFYEFVLSKILLAEYRNQEKSEPISWILGKCDQFDYARAHFSYREALKSLLVRFGLENRSLDLEGLVRRIPDLAYRSFAQQCLRELLFETEQPVMEAFDKIIAKTTGEEFMCFEEAQLTVATNSQKVIDSALKGLFSGEDHRAHHCIHILLSLDMKHKNLVRQRSREILNGVSALDEPHCKGLLYLYVLYFCWNYRDTDPANSLAEASNDYMDLVMRFPAYQSKLVKNISDLIRRWGPRLFSTNSQGGDEPFNYPWERMGKSEREFALRVGRAIGKDFADLTAEDFEAIRFFSMELPKVGQMNQPRTPDMAQEYPLESKLGQWTFIRHGKTHFNEIIEMLDGFMQTRDSCTSDFCICLLYEILTYHFQPNSPEYQRGYEQLRYWVNYFCEHDEGFFNVLQSDDAYTDTNNPLEETAYIFSDLNPREASNLFLDQWIKADEPKRKKLGLLAVCRMWRKTGMQALNSASSLFQSQDQEIHSWLNRLMKEISLSDRRLYEQYLSNLSLPDSRLQEIENTRSFSARTNNFRSDALIKMFFSHGIGRIRLLQDWHRKIYESASLNDYLHQLANRLVEQQREEYLNLQPPFSNP